MNDKLLQLGFCVLWIFSGAELLWQSIPVVSGMDSSLSDAHEILGYLVVSVISWGVLYYLVAEDKKKESGDKYDL